LPARERHRRGRKVLERLRGMSAEPGAASSPRIPRRNPSRLEVLRKGDRTMSRVLIVEDNELNARLLRDVLTHRDHVVIVAVTVAAARARLQESLPDVVLTDLRLPDGRGDQVLAGIRSDPATAHLAVVVITASAMVGDRERLIALGFDGYMSKPINIGEIERDMVRFAALSEQRRPPPAES
jgi:CheY-like chemotaxis protein